jgi:hypothetical protein
MFKKNRSRRILKNELTLRKKQNLFISKKNPRKTSKSFAYLLYVFLFSIASTCLFGYFAISNSIGIKQIAKTNLRETTTKRQFDTNTFDEIFGDINNVYNNKEKFHLLVKNWLNEYKYEFNRTPPENYDKWINFSVKNNCPLHPKYYTQIYKDLKPFREINSTNSKKISYKMIIEASKLPNIVLVFLNNRFFYVNKQDSNINEYKKLFSNDLLNILSNRTILLPFNLLDEPRVLLADNNDSQDFNHDIYETDRLYAFKRNNCLKKNFEKLTQFHSYFSYSNLTLTPLLPIFSRSRTKCHKDILIPAYYHMKPGLVDKKIWKDKHDIFKWHGTTVPLSEMFNTEKSLFGLNDKILKQQRTRLIAWSLKMEKDSKLPVKFDISLTKIRGCQSNACEYIKKNYKINENFNEMDTFQAKYVCVLDSFKRSSSKLLNYLFTKSVLLVSTIFEEWYSGIILPWQHYIPFQIDFSDLEKNIIWAFKNQSEAQKISLRGQISSHKYLNFKCMQCYTGLLILEYAHLLI